MKIGIIGCGTIGSCLAERLSPQNDLLLYDRNPEKMQQVAQNSNGRCWKESQKILDGSDIVILAVKPKDLASLALGLGRRFAPHQLLISALTGTSIQDLQQAFGTVPILRIMPNLAISCGKGVIGLSDNNALADGQKKAVETAFSPLGFLYWLPESMMDALTSLTGSGPGFICVLIEAMVDAAVAMGFPANEGSRLVYETLKGTLELLEASGQHPAELKWKVASPNGTTIAGLRELEANGVRSGIIETFIAAYERAGQIHQ